MPHIHELIDWTVEAYIVHQDKVLLRLHDKYNIWLGVGGHVELDEDPNHAAVREAKEEVGLDIELFPGNFVETGRTGDYKDIIPPYYMNMHKIGDTHQHIALIYFATTQSADITPENADDKWLWLSKSELEAKTDILPDVKHYGLAALEKLAH